MFQASDPQGKLFGGWTRLAEWVGKDSFYAYLGREGRRIFEDDLFREWYSADNGRPCVPPSSLAIATVLQMYDKCSDEEAIERCLFDDRWKVALDLSEQEKPFAKSTFQEFRAKLVLHEGFEKLFLRLSLGEATRHGLFKSSKINTVLDTTPILGRGALKDTYNLVGDGIKLLCRALCKLVGEELNVFALRLNLPRYFDEAVSLKGGAEIDWTDGAQRRVFLNSLVCDAQRLLLESTRIRANATDEDKAAILQAEELLRKLVVQDVEPDPTDESKVRIKQGTAKDRIPSAHDPEMRHGRKSASKRFDGHKLAIAAEPESGLVTALEILPGNAPDSEGALQLVEETESNTGLEVERTIGDCAYGDGATRQRFVDEQRDLTAKVPAPPSEQPFHKTYFHVDLVNDRVTCPVGVTTSEFKWVSSDSGDKVKRFFFSAAVCQACPAKKECLRTKDESLGRTVTLHPQEPLLKEAREYQKNSPAFQQDMKSRQRVEHVLSRMVQIGVRQARYVGKAKTRLQVVLAATVLNLLIILGTINDAQSQTTTAQVNSLPPEAVAGKWSPADVTDSSLANDTIRLHRQSQDSETSLTGHGIRGSPHASAGPSRGDP